MKIIAWLTQTFGALHFGWREILIAAAIFAITFVGSLLLVSVLLVKLPATYFQPNHPREFWVDRHPVIRLLGLILKNLLGLILVALGILLSLPGVPGQGFLTILLGIMLLDFPGKLRLERKLVSQPRVLRAINQLRERFAKPPLLLDENPR